MSREMKHSGIEWIGEIPKEWNVMSIKHYCISIYAGGTPQSNKSEYWDGDIPWIPSGSCKNCIIESAPKYITQQGLENSSTKLIPSGTTVMAMTGATCSNVGFVTFDTCMNQSVVSYIENKEKTISKFLFYLLQGAQEDILTHKTGGAQSGINVDDCKNIVVPYVPLFEQQKIANYLDKVCGEVDEMIALQEQMIEELKAYKQSVITEAVTKGLNPDVPMKNSGIDWIGEVPEHWEIVRLKALGVLQNGISQSGDYFGEDFEYPFISYSDVYKNIEIPYPSGRANSTIEDRTRYSVQEGDVLFTRTSETIEEIGFAATCTNTITNAVFSGFIIRFRPNSDRLYKGYSKYYFRSDIHRAYFVKEMNLVTRASLSQDLLKNLFVLIPSFSEQQSIASYLDTKCAEIDALIAIKQAKIEELKEYKKSIIYEYVTGKKEVV